MLFRGALFRLTLPAVVLLKQTAQRKIREIIQQVKQQEQKHQQGAAVSPQHSKWPAGRRQQAPANECSPPTGTETCPGKGWGQGDMQGRPAAPVKTKELHFGENMWEPKAEGACVHCRPCESRQSGRGRTPIITIKKAEKKM